MPVAAVKPKTFQFDHPLAFALEPAILTFPATEFELFHLHLTVAEFVVVVHSGVRGLLEAKNLAALGIFLAELMQSDMLGDRDCE
jgi:hypothetical protein